MEQRKDIGGCLNTLALDPGGHTGASIRIGDRTWTCVCDKPSQVWDLIVPELDEVVYERFASSIATSHFAIYTIELCGSIQGYVAAMNTWLTDQYGEFCCEANNCSPIPFNWGAHTPEAAHQIVLVRHEPQNRLAFLSEAKAIVHEQRKQEGKPYDKTIVHEIDATAHRLAREALGDDVRKRNYGKGISNA